MVNNCYTINRMLEAIGMSSNIFKKRKSSWTADLHAKSKLYEAGAK